MVLKFESVAVAAGAALLLLFGGFVMVAFGRQLFRIWRGRNWYSTPCEVLSIQAVGVEDFTVEISYSYLVGTTLYKSDRFSFADNVSVNDAHGIAKRHPPGSEAVCFVNPTDPADSVFMRSVNIVPTALLFAVGGVCTACGVYLAWLVVAGKAIGG